MAPFHVDPRLDPLTSSYPTIDQIILAARSGTQEARNALCRLWLSEGIPYAFRSNPGLYEAVREWLAPRLEIEAKELTLIGSARLGFSVASGRNRGRAFSTHSDLDLTAVSSQLFARIRSAYERWQLDYERLSVEPRNEMERALWNENRRTCPSGLNRGFIDPHKIPTWKRYPESQEVSVALYVAHQKLKSTAGAPDVRRLSLRVYSSWDSFVRQMALNLKFAAQD
jgi:hypothetical protein